MIVDDDYFPEDYSPYRTYARVGHPDGVTKANFGPRYICFEKNKF